MCFFKQKYTENDSINMWKTNQIDSLFKENLTNETREITVIRNISL